MADDSTLQTTPLHTTHLALKARMVPYGGWHMPVEYTGITQEHLAVRERAGLFDVSHMGEIEIAGADALAAVQTISTNDASRLEVGQIQYSVLATPEGTFVDDILVYRLADDHFLLVVNAANIARDAAWIRSHLAAFDDAVMVDASRRYALLALQGPAAAAILQPLTGVELADLKYYRFDHGEIAGVRGTVSRTGYTGEDGFEVFVPPAEAPRVWQAILEEGRDAGILPAGLGARDTLRLEAGMRLYGNDMDDTTSVLEAGLGWVVGWKKSEPFIGAEVLRRQKAEGAPRTLVGLEMADDRAIARHGYPVVVDGSPVGVVTSGTRTPFLKKNIAMAYVPTELADRDAVEVEVRGRRAAARVVPMPFYKRPRS